jgi:hypothetical protein
MELLSQMALGQPKSAEHKVQIAAGQRRRHAAARVLRAVEAVYEAQGTAAGGSTVAIPMTAQVTAAATPLAAPASARPAAEPPASAAQAASGARANETAASRATANGAANGATNAAASGAANGTTGGAGSSSSEEQSLQASRLAAYRLASGGGALGGPALGGAALGAAAAAGTKKRKMSRAQILSEYKMELREYRALQVSIIPAGGRLCYVDACLLMRSIDMRSGSLPIPGRGWAARGMCWGMAKGLGLRSRRAFLACSWSICHPADR